MALPVLVGAAAVAAIGYLASKESDESKKKTHSSNTAGNTGNRSGGTEPSAEKKLNEYLDSRKMTNRLRTYSEDDLWRS